MIDWFLLIYLSSFTNLEFQILVKVRLDSIIRPVIKSIVLGNLSKIEIFFICSILKQSKTVKFEFDQNLVQWTSNCFVFAGFLKLDLLNNQTTKTFLYFKPPSRILFSVIKPTIGVFEPIFETAFLYNLFSIISYCKASTTSMDALTNLTPASGIH